MDGLIDPAVLDAMLAAGASAEVIVAAVKADAAKDEARRKAKRANNAERQRRYKARHALDNGGNALPSVTERCDPSLNKSPQTPKINPTPHTHGEGAPAHTRGATWACPEGVDPQHWRDFRANRRKKKLTDTDTSFAGQMRLLERCATDEWPPGRLVQHAAEKGWGTIVDPSEYETPRNGQRPANDRSHSGNAMFRVGLEEFGTSQAR